MDTIKVKLCCEDAGNIDLLASIPQYLEKKKAGADEQTGRQWISGNLGNLKVIVSENAVSVRNGSLTKWYLGDNMKMMNRGDIQRAIEKLSDCLHLPMQKATVQSLHFGKNILLNHPVKAYWQYLAKNGRYARFEPQLGINYKVQDRELCFYDKVAEMKSKGDTVLPLYDGRNVLRYEKRYLHRLAQYFNTEKVTAEKLYDETFYMGLITDWYNDFKNIQKTKLSNINMSAVTTKEQMKMLGVMALVEMQGGKLAALQNIKERQLKKELNKKQAYDLKQLIEQSTKQKLHTIESDLVQELDQKMKEAVKYFR